MNSPNIQTAVGISNIPVTDMSHEEWLEARKSTIGGSEVAAILGISEYQTPYQLWEVKTGRRVPADLSENQAVIFGNLLEDVIADEFSRRTGRKVLRDNFIRKHPQYPFLTGNIDRIITAGESKLGRGILEIKTVNGWTFKEWEMKVPEAYYCQIQHYMGLTGYEYGAFAILVDGRRLEIIEVKADWEFINYQNSKLVEWYEAHIVNDIPPQKSIPDYEESQHIPEKIVEASPEIFELYADIRKYKLAIKELEEKKDAAEEVIKTVIGDCEGIAYGPDIIATWKTQESNRFDTTAFKKANPELYNQFIKTTQSRVFRLKEIK